MRLFSYASGRGAKHAKEIYAGIRPGAALMTDGYELYNGLAIEHQLIHLGCWAHARRAVIKAEEAVPKALRTPQLMATRFVKLIGKLFAAESRSADWLSARRQRLRRRYSARVLTAIEKLLLEQLPNVVPGSLLGKALQYLHGQWPKLIRYVENGDWPISNNACENAIRPFVVSRKNFLFSTSVAGAKASANFYSLIETCKANRVDPYQYLVWLFRKLPLANTADDYAALLPWSMPASCAERVGSLQTT